MCPSAVFHLLRADSNGETESEEVQSESDRLPTTLYFMAVHVHERPRRFKCSCTGTFGNAGGYQ